MQEQIKQTISYSREVCICPICKAKHNKKIKHTLKEANKVDLIKGTDCPNRKADICNLKINNPKMFNKTCDYIESKEFYSCPNNK